MLESLLDYALQEWHVIAGAPVALLVCALLFAGVAALFVRTHYSGQLETQEKRIQFLAERLDHGGAVALVTPPLETLTAGIYEGAHEKLMNFVIQYLFPTIDALETFQGAIISCLCPNAIVADYARRGVDEHPNVRTFKDGIDGLAPRL